MVREDILQGQWQWLFSTPVPFAFMLGCLAVPDNQDCTAVDGYHFDDLVHASAAAAFMPWHAHTFSCFV